MDIITAFKYLKCGYRIRREDWARNFWISPNVYYANMTAEDVLANDWIIITEGITKEFPISYDRGKHVV